MKKIVTRFAGMSSEEFGSQHATYAAGHTLKEHSGGGSGGGGGSGSGNGQNAAAATGRNRKHLGEQQPQPQQRSQRLRQQERQQQRQQAKNAAISGNRNGVGNGGDVATMQVPGSSDLHQAQLGSRPSIRPSLAGTSRST